MALNATIRRKLAEHGWPPKSRLARLTLYFAAVDLLFVVVWALATKFRFSSESGWAGWVKFLTFLITVFAAFLLLGWIRKKLLWRLRNRLFVTYVFIGVIPVVLLVTLGTLGAYYLGEQFASFVVASSLQGELQHLDTLNARVASDIAERLRRGGAISRESVAAATMAEMVKGEAAVSAWYEGKPLLPNTALPPPDSSAPQKAYIYDNGRVILRAQHTEEINGKRLVVMSSMPLDKALVEKLSTGIGQITIAPFQSDTDAHAGVSIKKTEPNQPHVSLQVNQQKLTEHDVATSPATVRAGVLPPPANRFDWELASPGILETVNAADPKTSRSVLFLVQSRPSLLYERLFSTVGPTGQWILNLLIGVAAMFGVMELFALAIGLRMTRTITASVHSLYAATEHVNKGDLTYRINVKRSDQLAALESSFNSMTGSLQRLLAEQKEKQKMEHELAIGAEVQAQLFPKNVSDLPTLEVFGICKPARTVSGDYYDFLPFPADKLGIAVGDVSGKGISAALLMATIHSAVRAYTLETAPAHALHGVGAALAGESGEVSPSALMALLNRQLYKSTPQEKYATMFFGSFEARSRRMTYCNAGHLAPLLLAPDGSLRRLDAGGTVVGLFDGVPYTEDEVRLSPGDLFIAFSDGVTEPENDFGEFGEERLLELIGENRDLPLSRIAEVVTAAVYDWIGGAEQPDDITLVLARAR